MKLPRASQPYDASAARNPKKRQNPGLPMAVWKSAEEAVTYDGNAVKNPDPLQTGKTAGRVACVRSGRGYSATIYDASPVKTAKVLRGQLGENYNVKKVRNTSFNRITGKYPSLARDPESIERERARVFWAASGRKTGLPVTTNGTARGRDTPTKNVSCRTRYATVDDTGRLILSLGRSGRGLACYLAFLPQAA